MTYVDPLLKWPRPKGARPTYSGKGEMWCHLIADTREELEQMARKLELRPSWFQDHKRQVMQHYDLTPAKRTLAVKYGAQELTHLEFRKLLASRITVK